MIKNILEWKSFRISLRLLSNFWCSFCFLVDGSGDNDEEGFFTDQIKVDIGDEGNRHFKTVNHRISASPRMNIPPLLFFCYFYFMEWALKLTEIYNSNWGLSLLVRTLVAHWLQLVSRVSFENYHQH